MRLILSCFHMDGTGNGENNDNLSPLRVFYQASARHSISCSLAPQPSGSETGTSTRVPLVVAAPSTWAQVCLAVDSTAYEAPHEAPWGQTFHSRPQPPPPPSGGQALRRAASASPRALSHKPPLFPALRPIYALTQPLPRCSLSKPEPCQPALARREHWPSRNTAPPPISANIFKC